MELRFALPHSKRYFDNRKQRLGFLSGIVACGIEYQSVKALGEVFCFRQQLAASSLPIRVRRSQHMPTTSGFVPLQSYWHVGRWLAKGKIEDVRRNPFHP
jgi:hypothetical protein